MLTIKLGEQVIFERIYTVRDFLERREWHDVLSPRNSATLTHAVRIIVRTRDHTLRASTCGDNQRNLNFPRSHTSRLLRVLSTSLIAVNVIVRDARVRIEFLSGVDVVRAKVAGENVVRIGLCKLATDHSW